MENKINIMPWLEDILQSYGITVQFAIDRLRVYFDASTHSNTLNALVQDQESYNEVTWQCLPKYADMDRTIELMQPDTDKIDALRRAVSGDYVINYVEFAINFYCDDQPTLEKWRGCLEKMLVFQRHSRRGESPFYFCNYDGTHYHAPEQEKIVQVLYSDRIKNGKTAPVHLEKRFMGTACLRKAGVSVIDDLLYFDSNPYAFWGARLDLRIPEWEKFGKLLKPQKKATPKGRNLRARTFLQKQRSLQEALANNPHYYEALKPFPTKKSLEEFVKYYMSN